MPIKYEKLIRLLEKREVSTYYLINNGIMGKETLRRIQRNDGHISTQTIEKLCELLDCQPGDIIEYEPK